MAERLADVARQIDNVRQLEGVVTAMRGIAASRAQRGRAMLPAISAYTNVVSRAIGEALSLDEPVAGEGGAARAGNAGLILLCAEQGFAGAFSERILDCVDIFHNATVLIVGTRGVLAAGERGLKSAWTAPMATHADGLAALANQIAEALYGFVASGDVTKVEIIYSRAGHGGLQSERRLLLPIDYRRFPRANVMLPPLTTLDSDTLITRLAGEYVFAQLCEAITLSFEAENEARMLAMTLARTNVSSRLEELRRRERQLRQDEITNEIIELAAGGPIKGRRLRE